MLSYLARLRLPRLKRSVVAATMTAVVGTVLFFLPLMNSLHEGSAHWPAFMLVGDVYKLWFPQFVEGYYRFWQGGMFGVDFLTQGGSSVYGFRANLLSIYPPYLVAYSLLDIGNIDVAKITFAAIHVVHIYVAIYYSVIFSKKYLGLSTSASILFSVVYSLSFIASYNISFTPFYFQMMLLPLVAYALCWALFARSWVRSLLVSPIVLTMMLAGYGPTMGAALLVAGAVCLFVFYTRIWKRIPTIETLKCLLGPALAGFAAMLIAVPYYAAQASYVRFTSNVPGDLKHVAHELSFSGTDILRSLSGAFVVDATREQIHPVWGLIPTFLLVIAVFVIIINNNNISRMNRRSLIFGISIYIPVFLASLGSSTIISDFLYYAAPLFGDMHVYQRYLIAVQFPFAMAIAAGASIVIESATKFIRISIFSFGVISWFLVSLILFLFPDYAEKVFYTERIAAQVFIFAIGLAIIAVGRKPKTLILLAIPISIISVESAYYYERDLGSESTWSDVLDPGSEDMEKLVSTLAESDLVLPKVLNVTSAIDSYLPHNLSWFRPGSLHFMNYLGYELHLASEVAYRDLMGGYYGRFNRNWVLRTGVNFVAWDEDSEWKLRQITADTVALGPTTELGGGVKLTELIYAQPPLLGQGGPLFSFPQSNPEAWQISFMNGWDLKNGRMIKVSGGETNNFAVAIPPALRGEYTLAFDVEGRTSGQMWVALGNETAPEPIETSGHHEIVFDVKDVGDLWFTAAPDFNGAVTNIEVRQSGMSQFAPGYASRSDNGVLRLESMDESAALTEFSTDWSTRIAATINSASASRLVYELWPNRFLTPYLDGKKSEWIRVGGWPAYLDLPAGEHRFELRFESAFVSAIWVGAILYGLLILAAGLAALMRRASFQRIWRRLAPKRAL